MSKRATHAYAVDGKLSEHEARQLLTTLCTTYGFCLPPLWRARLTKNPPQSVDKFLDTVFRAEGLDPITADSGMYKSMREEVCLAFERSKLNHEVPDA